jgi:hypothetical protein
MFDEEAMESIRKDYQIAKEKYDGEVESWWNDLSYDEQLKAFYAVCKRIHKGDIQDQGSFRYVLYEVFGFDMDSYIVGMDCGYMDIHNAIVVDKKED